MLVTWSELIAFFDKTISKQIISKVDCFSNIYKIMVFELRTFSNMLGVNEYCGLVHDTPSFELNSFSVHKFVFYDRYYYIQREDEEVDLDATLDLAGDSDENLSILHRPPHVQSCLLYTSPSPRDA